MSSPARLDRLPCHSLAPPLMAAAQSRQQRQHHLHTPRGDPRHHRRRREDLDRAIISTADDAALAKLSCCDRGYYDDPFIRPMARGASRLANPSSSSLPDTERRRHLPPPPLCGTHPIGTHPSSSLRPNHPIAHRSPSQQDRLHPAVRRRGCGGGVSDGTEPIIRRGTHARVCAVERAIRAFLSLPTVGDQKSSRQVVILGAGRDTSYLRYRFGYLNGGVGDAMSEEYSGGADRAVRWYEVDHPSVIRTKAESWLSGCVPRGYEYRCDPVVVRRDPLSSGNDGDGVCGDHPETSPPGEAGADDNPLSFAISITEQTNTSEKMVDEKRGNPSAPLPPHPYHLIGYDLRSDPAELFEGLLADPRHGYDRSAPTLFVLECVLMYMPDLASRTLLRYLAAGAVVSEPDGGAFAAVLVYDPIPGRDGFGEVMIRHLRRAGISSRCGGGGGGVDCDGGDDEELSLDRTRSLADQLDKLIDCGFDVAAGCTMSDAYDGNVILPDQRTRASRCEMLDELEEFVLMMRHYCLAVGVSSVLSTGEKLCSVGSDSPIGFVEGRCAVVHREGVLKKD